MSSLTSQELLAMPIGELAVYAPEILCQLKSEAVDFLASAQAVNAHIDLALEQRYTEHLQPSSHADEKNICVSFVDGDVSVSVEWPQEVSWDQTMLAEMARRIAEAGGDPSEFIEIRYSVSLEKLAAWKPSLQRSFAAARRLKAGQPRFTFKLTTEY